MKRIVVDVERIASEGDFGGVESVRRGYADMVDLVRMRSDILNRADRVFLRMYLEKGSKVPEIAQLVGISEVTVARRIKRLVKRLLDGRYVACLRNQDKLSRFERTIAREYFIDGLSVRKIALKRRITDYKVQKAVRSINELLRTEKCRY